MWESNTEACVTGELGGGASRKPAQKVRHSYISVIGTRMASGVTALYTVKEWLGHRSILTRQIYLHTSPKGFVGLRDP